MLKTFNKIEFKNSNNFDPTLLLGQALKGIQTKRQTKDFYVQISRSHLLE